MAVSPALSLLFFILPTVTGQKEGIALFQCRNETSRLSGGSEQENVVQERISSFEGCVLPHNRNKKEDRQFCYVYSSKDSSCAPQKRFNVRTPICMDKSCDERGVQPYINNRLDGSNGSELCSVSCYGEAREGNYSRPFTWIFLGILFAIVVIAIIATGLEYFSIKSAGKEKNASLFKKTWVEAILSFSMITNGSRILDIFSPRGESNLKSLDFLRFASMVWIATGHIFDYVVPAEEQLIHDSYAMNALKSFPIAVDTFLVLSGLLVTYNFFKQVAKNPEMVKEPHSWLMMYVHRYLRLTPSYILFIGFLLAVVPLLSGIVTFHKDVDGSLLEPCREHWWKNLFYVNNLFTVDQCYRISWYLALDMQCFIVAPLFLAAFFHSALLGYFFIVAACAASAAYTTYLVYHFELSGSNVRATIEKVDMFDVYLYFNPLVRCTVYFIGMGAGYILAKHGSKKVSVHWAIPTAIWILAAAVTWFIISGPADYNVFKSDWSLLTSAHYYVFNRIFWALAIVWVILAVHYGYGGPLVTLLQHPIWQPFGRLNYCVYLTHKFFVYFLWDYLEQPPQFAGIIPLFLQQVIPVLFMSYVFSFYWSSLIEIPFMRLEKMLFDFLLSKKDRRKTDGGPTFTKC